MVNCVKPPLYTWDLEESDSEGSENEAGQRLLLERGFKVWPRRSWNIQRAVKIQKAMLDFGIPGWELVAGQPDGGSQE